MSNANILQRLAALEKAICCVVDGAGGGGGGTGGAPVLTRDLTVQQGPGGSVGGSITGEFFPAGTLLEDVIRDIEIKAVGPTYVAPTVDLNDSGEGGGDYESGTIVNPVLAIVFHQHDAGALVSERITRNGTSISTASPFTDTNYQILDGDNNYQGFVTYATGPVKNNNLGVPDATGQIIAGTVGSFNDNYIGYRNGFYGVPTDTTPIDSSALVRALDDNLLNPAGQDQVIDIPIGTAQVVFALPDTLTLNYVQDINLSNTDIQSSFIQSNVSVEGANGYAAIGYIVYTYTPVEPFTTIEHYRINAS